MTDHLSKVPAIREPGRRRKGNGKLLALLLLFFLTVLVILFFQSSLSKILHIDIKGNELVPAETIGQAAGIQPGEFFFSVSSAKIEKRIRKLPVIEDVKVTKHFPGQIYIRVKEYPRVGFQFTESGQRQVLLADGTVLDVDPDSPLPVDKPIFRNWPDGDPLKVALCKTLSQIPDHLLSDVSEIRPDPSASYPDKILIYTRSGFEVHTTVGYLPDKIPYLDLFVRELHEKNITTGMIQMLETDSHLPFPDVAGEERENDEKAEAPRESGDEEAAG